MENVLCIDCDKMVCRVFYAKKESWEGFCMEAKRKVYGKDHCLATKQKSLFEKHGLLQQQEDNVPRQPQQLQNVVKDQERLLQHD